MPTALRTQRTTQLVLLVITLFAFVLRMVHLADVPPRWDEGWSVAHASLGLTDLFTITSADVHPPLYYMLLGAWQNSFGIHLFGARFLSVLMSVPSVPLAYAAAVAWSRNRRMGLYAAAFMAVLPLAVYYGAVIRMYALAPTFLLLAAWGLLRMLGLLKVHQVDQDAPRPQVTASNLTNLGNLTNPINLAAIGFIIGAVGAMLTLYHAAWALVALGVYALGIAVGRRRSAVVPVLIVIALAGLLYLPWAIYAIPQLYGRAAAETAGNVAQHYSVGYFIEQGVRGLLLTHQTGDLGWVVPALIVVCGVAGHLITRVLHQKEFAVRRSTLQMAELALPVLMIVFTLIGTASAARQWAFNERMMIGAIPGLALLLAWSFEALRLEPRAQLPGKSSPEGQTQKYGLVLIAAVTLVATFWRTSTDFVYRKSLEVFEPYNPHTYHQHIAPKALPGDQVIFNVLSPAGFYALDRAPDDPTWSYALSWDPVVEPRARWEARINAAAVQHPRLWLVLYRGLAEANGDLRGWMDSTFYPAAAEWGEEEVFYGLYGAPRAMQLGEGAGVAWGDLRLSEVRIGAQVAANDIIPVALTWQAVAPLSHNYKVFVHALAADGFSVAQHDAMPLNDLRPMTTLPVNEAVRDHHGLALPAGYTGELTLVLGLYDPETNQRILTRDGRDQIEIGRVQVGGSK